MNTILIRTFAAAALFVLVACGGGGGGGAGVVPSAKSWGTAQLIESDDRGDATGPQVVVDAAGNAMAVWSQSDGVTSNIYSSRYSAGQGWDAPVEIDNVSNWANSPQIAMDANGNAIAVWEQQGGAGVGNIYANRYTPGIGWGAAELIEHAIGEAGNPQIAVDAAGNAMAVWRQFMTSAFRIRAARYVYDSVTGTGVWEAPEEIETTLSTDARDAQIAVDAGGNAIAVWSQVDATTSDYAIWANSYDPAHGWYGASQISAAGTPNRDPRIAFDAAGNAMLVWRQFNGTRNVIMASRLTVGAGASVVTPVDDALMGTSSEPRIAVDPIGNAIAVWNQYDGTLTNVWANRYNATNGAWGTAQLVAADDSDIYSDPDVTVDAAGNAIAVWLQLDVTGNYNIRNNRYSIGQGWGAAQTIDIGSPWDANSPQITLNAAGNAAVVWEQFDSASGHYNIWASTYR